ncbi:MULTISPECIES: FAD synthetase family protein [unclassified Bacillus cereus group]|uniref:FAD synthetase family protein n=1 Tax=unclassified Bacillus cereus group TaxID=2750818 RepID=UPI0024C921B1|nr:MAG: FAD synthetase family protein [Bacillus paranthracis]WAI31132.1 MAG: FAD synthetase family protein [Bacillus paranthracis]WAI40717.1 MAG: FAD synthetase family protein [Bacillus paranthracis]
MSIIYIHEQCIPELTESIVSIGVFDGVHKGHQAVIKNAVEKAKALKITNVVYTFDPPPRSYFQGAQVLTTIDEKVKRIQNLGVEHVIVIRFDESYITKSASCFIQDIKRLSPVEIFIGQDFRFGKNREGNIELLREQFNLSIVKDVCCDEGERISSTRIRDYVYHGDLQKSSSLLGWSFKTI